MADKYEEWAQVIYQDRIADGIFDLTLATEQIAQHAVAGQFVSMYTDNPTKLLPRPISLCEIDRDGRWIRLVYRVTGEGTGTQEFSRLVAGERVRLLGPLGNGFPIKNGKKALLIGGGIGIPPMLQLAKQLWLENEDVDFTAVLGYRDAEMFLLRDFQSLGKTAVATEDGSIGTKGNVLDAVRGQGLGADVIYACGPMPMLRAVKAYALEQRIECYVSLEERMACGIGACLACVCRTTERDAHSNVNNKRICKEGPVFDAREVEL